MKRFKAALKGVLGWIIAGLVLLVVSGVTLSIALLSETSSEILFWIGLLSLMFGVICFVAAFAFGQRRLRAICPECQKFMGDSAKGTRYSYECLDYEDIYDNTGKYKGTKFHYSCEIICPHCGNAVNFEYKVTAQSATKADIHVNQYLRALLSEKEK